MRTVLLPLAIATATLLTAGPALAQAAAGDPAPLVLKAGHALRTVDGRTVGDIEDVQKSGGQPISVSVIFNQRFIHVPASTLSAGSKGIVTSLTSRQLALLAN